MRSTLTTKHYLHHLSHSTTLSIILILTQPLLTVKVESKQHVVLGEREDNLFDPFVADAITAKVQLPQRAILGERLGNVLSSFFSDTVAWTHRAASANRDPFCPHTITQWLPSLRNTTMLISLRCCHSLTAHSDVHSAPNTSTIHTSPNTIAHYVLTTTVSIHTHSVILTHTQALPSPTSLTALHSHTTP